VSNEGIMQRNNPSLTVNLGRRYPLTAVLAIRLLKQIPCIFCFP